MKKLILLFLVAAILFAQSNHPNLILTKKDVQVLRENWEKYPLIKKSFEAAKEKVDNALASPIDVPIPKDAAAYTHEKHKQNYNEMQLAGIVYQVTQEKKYAEFIKRMLMKYADLYPTLGKHPAAASNSPGRLFWQSLNETVWLVNTTQAYDCIYDYLTASERKKIEENVFRKMVDFLLTERVHEFDLLHNHGTWMVAAIGMAGFVMNDMDLVEKSLYGSKKDKKYGFLREIETLFSPDGYYTEGAYYVRYALAPFFLFAEAINNNQPELKIYQFRDQLLKKGFYGAMELTYTNGAFIPINDAIKEKNYLSPELITSLNLTYKHYGKDDSILGIAKRQDGVMLNEAGVLVAEAISKTEKFENYNYKSIEFTDGANGDEGGIALIRNGSHKDQSLLVMKYTSHGLSHGHYDKLSFCFYDNGNEILQDYGSARFINVEQKWGGRYLPENKSWAMQSIAHNTISVDEKCQFEGKINLAEQFHSDRHFFELSKGVQIVSAKDEHAFPGVKMQRTMAVIKDKLLPKPIVVDVFKVDSDKEHQYDLPFYYMGHLIGTNINYLNYEKELKPMGSANGYQHLWKQAEGNGTGVFQFTWLNEDRFYTITSSADSSTKIYFTRIGASDPKFNLRNDAGIMLRKKAASNVFATVIEPHGVYDGVREFTAGSFGQIESVKVLASNNEASAVRIQGKNGIDWTLLINNGKFSADDKYSISVGEKKYEWTGNYKLVKNKD